MVVGAALGWGGALTLAAWAAQGLTKLVSSYSYNNCWRFPAFDKLKMNTDGSVQGVGFGLPAGFGVVIRDDSGVWVIGFCGTLKHCWSSSEAELWGIYKGLQIIQENNWREVDIETDLRSTVELINDGNHAKSHIKKIVEECKVMMLRTGCTLKLISDKANKVADELTNFGRGQDEEFVLWSIPPYPTIGSLVFADWESARSVRAAEPFHRF